MRSAISEFVNAPFPLYLSGTVVKGFGRGSKELGIPTANFSEEVADGVKLANGIYFGWASLMGNGYPMVMSIGWNPFYKNTKKSVEVHLIQQLEDFYGKKLDIVILGYMREERNYSSIKDLIDDINLDIQLALEALRLETYKCFENSLIK